MALFIVAIHTNPFWEYNPFISYFVSQVLARLGVPFFAAIAGYYFFLNESDDKYIKMIQRYLQPYLIWSLVYFILSALLKGIKSDFNYYIKTMVFTGYYHLWYMLAIMYTVIIVWVFQKFRYAIPILYYISLVCLLLGIFMFGYGNLLLSIPIAETMIGKLDFNNNMQTQWLFIVFPFFMMGHGFARKWKKGTWIYKNCEALLIILVIVWFGEVYFLQVLDLKRSTTMCVCIYPIIYLLMGVSLKHQNLGNYRTAKYCSVMASFTYFGHIFIVSITQKFKVTETPSYIIAVSISMLIGGIIAKLNRPLLNKFI